MKRIVRKKLAERLTTPLDSITDPVQLATALCTPESREIRTYSDRLRASNLIGCCVREQIIGHMIGRRKTVTVPPALAVIFDIGNSVHRVTQNVNLDYVLRAEQRHLYLFLGHKALKECYVWL